MIETKDDICIEQKKRSKDSQGFPFKLTSFLKIRRILELNKMIKLIPPHLLCFHEPVVRVGGSFQKQDCKFVRCLAREHLDRLLKDWLCKLLGRLTGQKWQWRCLKVGEFVTLAFPEKYCVLIAWVGGSKESVSHDWKPDTYPSGPT